MNVSDQCTIDVEQIRADFPILRETIHGSKPLIFLDSGASSQHPNQVIDAMVRCYHSQYANVHRGIHALSEAATSLYEDARSKTATFINARSSYEVIFTSGTTTAINLVARSWGDANLQSGDKILLTIFEHHSNIVPWQQLAERVGATVEFVRLDDEESIDPTQIIDAIDERTKIVAVSAVSNVLGCHLPIRPIADAARSAGAITVVDAAQHVPHEPTDVQEWGADFVAFSGHKMVGPSGIGVLWGRESLLEAMPPFLGGGSMITTVSVDGFTPGELPAKFEAGTPPIVPAVGLGAAVDYLQSVGMNAISQHERQLAEKAIASLQDIDGLHILGSTTAPRAGIVSFDIRGISALDIAFALDRHGVAVRAGHHCAMPLHHQLNLTASVRASFYLYNTSQEIEQFADLLDRELRLLRS